MAYKFTRKPVNPELYQILTEAEDNFASKEDISGLQIKTLDLVKQEPKPTELSNGDERVYDDGSNVYLYRKVGSRLFKIQMVEI